MRAELFHKGDFLFGGNARDCKIRRAEAVDKLRGQKFHQVSAIVLRRVDDLHQRRPAPRPHPKKATAERRPILAGQPGRIAVVEPERARYGPVPRLGRRVEHERVGWIERDGAQELHRRGPPSFGSNHDGAASALTRSYRPVLAAPRLRVTRSPLSSMRRLTSRSRESLPKYSRPTPSNPSTCQVSTASIRCRAKLSVTWTAPASPNPSCSSAEPRG